MTWQEDAEALTDFVDRCDQTTGKVYAARLARLTAALEAAEQNNSALQRQVDELRYGPIAEGSGALLARAEAAERERDRWREAASGVDLVRFAAAEQRVAELEAALRKITVLADNPPRHFDDLGMSEIARAVLSASVENE